MDIVAARGWSWMPFTSTDPVWASAAGLKIALPIEHMVRLVVLANGGVTGG